MGWAEAGGVRNQRSQYNGILKQRYTNFIVKVMDGLKSKDQRVCKTVLGTRRRQKTF